MKFNIKILLFVFIMCLIFLIAACEKEVWEQDTIVTVNGKAIKQNDLDEVLKAANYPQLAGKNTAEGAELAEFSQVIEKLIVQELLLQEAEKMGLNVEEEYKKAVEIFEASWENSSLEDEEQNKIKQGLYKQLLLHKITIKVTLENKLLSLEEWEEFWNKWLEKKKANPLVLVKAILLPKEDEIKDLLKNLKTSEKIREKLLSEEKIYVYSEEFLINFEKADANTKKALTEANKKEAKQKITELLEFDESFVIYEIIKFEDEPDLNVEMLKAKLHFEEYIKEKTFSNWLNDVKSKAVIKINPIYEEL